MINILTKIGWYVFIPWLLSDSSYSRFLVLFYLLAVSAKKDPESEAFSSCGTCLHKKTFGQLQLRSYTNITPIISFVVNAEKKYDDKKIISAGINVERLGRHLQEPDLADWRNYFSFYILHFSFFFFPSLNGILVMRLIQHIPHSEHD